jgi:xylan 1,4-beta-xylosidase
VQRTDAEHGNPLPAYLAMGSPRYPTQAQIAKLNEASALPSPTKAKLNGRTLEITLPVNGLAIIPVPAR